MSRAEADLEALADALENARTERLLELRRERILAAAGLGDAPEPEPVPLSQAERTEWFVDAAGQPVAPVRAEATSTGREVAAQVLREVRGWRVAHEAGGRREPASVTFHHAAHHAAVVATRLLLADSRQPLTPLTPQARAFAQAYALLDERAVRARAAWARKAVAA